MYVSAMPLLLPISLISFDTISIEKRRKNLTVLSFNELKLPCFPKFLEQIPPRNFLREIEIVNKRKKQNGINLTLYMCLPCLYYCPSHSYLLIIVYLLDYAVYIYQLDMHVVKHSHLLSTTAHLPHIF